MGRYKAVPKRQPSPLPHQSKQHQPWNPLLIANEILVEEKPSNDSVSRGKKRIFANGRRIPNIDEIQIKRWKAFTRHVTAIKKNCESGNIHCRRKQRQAILQWAYNPYI